MLGRGRTERAVWVEALAARFGGPGLMQGKDSFCSMHLWLLPVEKTLQHILMLYEPYGFWGY